MKFSCLEKIKRIKLFLKEIFYYISFKNKSMAFLFWGALLCNFLSWALIRWNISSNQEGVILHYNAFFGIDVISFDLDKNYLQAFMAPLGGLFVWLINFLVTIGLLMTDEEEVHVRTEKEAKNLLLFIDKNLHHPTVLGGLLLLGASLLVQLAILVYTGAIIYVNR